MNIKDKGKLGERLTAEYLKENGINILETNYHSRYGEVDIIANDNKFIMFIEVKLRKKGALVGPAESVIKSKRTKIIKTAYDYLLKHKSTLQPRFDVAQVSMSLSGKTSFFYIENAFTQDDTYAVF